MTEAGAGPSDPLDRPISRRRAALWMLGLRYVALALGMARTLAVLPLLWNRLDRAEYGAWFASGAVLIQLASTNFGFLGVLAQRVAAAYGRRDRDELERLLGTGFATMLVLSASLGILSASLAPLLPAWFDDIEGPAAERLVGAFFIASAAVGLQVFAFATSSLLESFQRTIHAGLQSVISELLAIGLTIWLVLEGYGLYGVAWGLLARAAWYAAATGLACSWLTRGELRLAWRWDTALFRSMWGASVFVFVMQLANWVRTSADRVLVGKLLGAPLAGVYANTTQAHDIVRTFVLTLGAAANPGLAHLFGEGNVERFKKVIASRYALQGAVTAIGLGGVLAFNETFVGLWLSPDSYAGDWVNLLAVIATASFILGTVPYDGLHARGEFALLARSFVIDSVVRVPTIATLLFFFGLAGAPAGNVIAQTFAMTLPLAALLASRFGQSRGELAAEVGPRLSRIVLPVVALAVAGWWLAPRAASWTAFVSFATAYTLAAGFAVAIADRGLTRFLLSRGREVG